MRMNLKRLVSKGLKALEVLIQIKVEVLVIQRMIFLISLVQCLVDKERKEQAGLQNTEGRILMQNYI